MHEIIGCSRFSYFCQYSTSPWWFCRKSAVSLNESHESAFKVTRMILMCNQIERSTTTTVIWDKSDMMHLQRVRGRKTRTYQNENKKMESKNKYERKKQIRSSHKTITFYFCSIDIWNIGKRMPLHMLCLSLHFWLCVFAHSKYRKIPFKSFES